MKWNVYEEYAIEVEAETEEEAQDTASCIDLEDWDLTRVEVEKVEPENGRKKLKIEYWMENFNERWRNLHGFSDGAYS
jgi:hypothetical protein